MRKVAILGIGQTKIDEHWDLSLREIGGNAAFAAMQDAGMEKVEALFVGNMLAPLVDGQNQLGTFFSDWIGLWHQESVKVEAACASGAAALRAGLMAVASGEMDSALVVGVEKMTDKAGHDVTSALATAADADYEVEQGISFVGINALVMRRYMYEFGWKHEDFAPFSINAHANAMHNPFARLHEKITVDKFEKSSMVATPINLLDASPIGDGAADAHDVLRHHAPGAQVEVSDFAVSHLSVAQADRPPRRVEARSRKPLPQTVEDGRPGERDPVPLALVAEPPAVQDDEPDPAQGLDPHLLPAFVHELARGVEGARRLLLPDTAFLHELLPRLVAPLGGVEEGQEPADRDPDQEASQEAVLVVTHDPSP